MSALDIAARGMARRAAALEPHLASAQGAFAIGRQRSEGQAILEPVGDILDRIDLSPASFGVLAREDGTDTAGLQAFAQAIAAAGEGIARLDARRYTTGAAGTHDALVWGQSNGGLIGRGRGRTVIENIHSAANFSMAFDQSVENLYFADIDFVGRVMPAGFGANSVKNVIFHRCGFTARAGQLINALTLTTQSMTEGAQFIYFIDCEIHDAGRMGAEITNHANDGIIRYANIYFIGCRFVRNGSLAGSVGFGSSISGRGERVVFDRCHWDGNNSAQIENAGCDRMLIRDAEFRAATLPSGVSPISFSANNATHNSNHGCEIDGLALVKSVGDPAGRPTMDSALAFSGTRNLAIRRVRASLSRPDNVNAAIVLVQDGGVDGQGNQRYSENITITDCDLHSDASNYALINFVSVRGQQVVDGNILHNSNPLRTGSLVANFGNEGGVVSLARNRLSAARPHSEKSFLTKTGTSTFAVHDDNNGLPVRASAVVTIPAGQTVSALANHDLPTIGTHRLAAKPMGNLNGASFPWTTMHNGATQFRANVGTAPSADLSVEIEARYEY